MLDLDHFKHVNDEHGHAVGDQTLCLFARLLQQQLRSDEIAARWGGEEFCLLLYTTDDGVDTLCTRLRPRTPGLERPVPGTDAGPRRRRPLRRQAPRARLLDAGAAESGDRVRGAGAAAVGLHP